MSDNKILVFPQAFQSLAEEENVTPGNYIFRLARACANGDLSSVHNIYFKSLQLRRPDPVTGHISDSWFIFAACHAIEYDRPTCLAYLCQQGLSVESFLVASTIYTALENKSTRCLQTLLDHGWDINMPEGASKPPFLGRVVEDLSLVHWFLEQGADPNARAGKWDITPLSYAVQRAPLETIKLLFHYGGSTARGQLLNMAVGRTDSECVPILQYLFDHGDTGINDASFENKPKCEEWSRLGNEAPLHHAARVGNIDAVKWLLEHGADPTKRTVCSGESGDLAVDIASFYGNTNIVNLLLQATEDDVSLLRSKITAEPKTRFDDEKHSRRWIPAPFEMNTVPEFDGTATDYIPTVKFRDRPRGDELQDYTMLQILMEQIFQKRKLKTRQHRESLSDNQSSHTPSESLQGSFDGVMKKVKSHRGSEGKLENATKLRS
ncbi:MAG: hypothetical protein Q9211_001032 [Gyalolechia sp. 1 TL-2023]